MEFNHLQLIPLGSLRNRLMLLHQFSELVCSSIALFDLQPRIKDHLGQGPLVALDALRGVLIPSGKASSENLSCHLSIAKPLDLRNDVASFAQEQANTRAVTELNGLKPRGSYVRCKKPVQMCLPRCTSPNEKKEKSHVKQVFHTQGKFENEAKD